jgi:hypothetical protein
MPGITNESNLRKFQRAGCSGLLYCEGGVCRSFVNSFCLQWERPAVVRHILADMTCSAPTRSGHMPGSTWPVSYGSSPRLRWSR